MTVSSTFQRPNQYCLEHLHALSQTHQLRASEDICTESGIKLLAKGKPISDELQEKLLMHKLKVPLELVIEVEDGVTQDILKSRAKTLVEENKALQELLGKQAAKALELVGNAHLGSVLKLLLTCAQELPSGLDHSLQVALLSAGMGLRATLPQSELDRLVTGAVVHDIGELYVNPAYLTSAHALDLQEWQYVAVHPIIGKKVIQELTDIGPEVAAIVAGHHEREDGSGYPARLTRAQQPRLTWVVSFAEATSGLLLVKDNPLGRIGMAQRLANGEFSSDILTLLPKITTNKHTKPTEAGAKKTVTSAHMLCNTLKEARKLAQDVKDNQTERLQVIKHVRDKLARLDALLHSTGVVALAPNEWGQWFREHQEDDMWLELEMVPKEIHWRLRSMARSLSLASHRNEGASQAYMHLMNFLAQIGLVEPTK